VYKEVADHPQSAVKSLCIDVHNRRMSWILGQHHIEIAMVTDDQKRFGRNLLQMSVILTVSA
jgi:hypothetical protein